MEISEDEPDFGLVSTRMVSVLKTGHVSRVANGAFALVRTENQPAFAGGIGFAGQPGLFVELPVHPIPCGECRQSQREDYGKEDDQNGSSHMALSVRSNGFFCDGLQCRCAGAGHVLS